MTYKFYEIKKDVDSFPEFICIAEFDTDETAATYACYLEEVLHNPVLVEPVMEE